jgi:MFS family permease
MIHQQKTLNINYEAQKFLFKYYLFYILQGMFFAGSFLIIIVNSTGISPVQVSLAVSCYFLIQILFEIPTGALADRFGRKKILVIAKIFALIGFFFLYLRRDFADILISYIMWGVGGTLMSGALEALMYDNMKHYEIHENYAKYQGKSFAIRISVFALTAFVASYLIKFGYDVVILATMIPWFLQIVILIHIKDEHRQNKNIQKLTTKYWKTIVYGSKYALKHRVVLKFVLFSAFFGATIEIIDQYYDLFLFQITNNLRLVPILISIESVVVALFSFFVTKYFQNKSLLSSILLLLSGCGLLLSGFVFYNLQLSYIPSVVFWAFLGVSYSIIDARKQMMIPAKVRATIISVSGFVMGLTGVASVSAFGFISKTFSYKIGFISMSVFQVVILLAFIFILGFDKHIKKREKIVFKNYKN